MPSVPQIRAHTQNSCVGGGSGSGGGCADLMEEVQINACEVDLAHGAPTVPTVLLTLPRIRGWLCERHNFQPTEWQHGKTVWFVCVCVGLRVRRSAM